VTIEPRKAKSPRILIVDDDPGQRSLLDSFLRARVLKPCWRIPANARSNCCPPANST